MRIKSRKRSAFLILITLVCSVLLMGLVWSSLPGKASLADAAKKIIYVDNTAAGKHDGTSWKDAFPNLQRALDKAKEGDEIRVAEGIYYPTKDIKGDSTPKNSRTKSFQLKNGVAILGGFSATDAVNRDAKRYKTILSGDLNRNGKVDGFDALHVFYHPQGTFLDPAAVLDGVTISGGNANDGTIADGSSGGGIYNHGSHPTLIGVTIEHNKALAVGGGIFNQKSHAIIEGGSIRNNSAGAGAGMYNQEGSPQLSDLIIEKNKASENGGGLASHAGEPALENVVIRENEAHSMGGGIFSQDNGMSLKGVHVTGNKAGSGAGIAVQGSNFNASGGKITLNTAASGKGGGVYSAIGHAAFDGIEISGNTAASGGGIYIERGSPMYTNLKIHQNTAKFGGGVSVGGGHPEFIGGSIDQNSASENGGGLFAGASGTRLVSVSFEGNEAKNGGGLYSTESQIAMLNGKLSGNQAAARGGGIYNYNSEMRLGNSLISGNEAASGGGLYSNYVTDWEMTNVTIAGNKAAAGGALYSSGSAPVVQNSIIWGNSTSVYNSNSVPDFDYSLIQGSGGSESWEEAFGEDSGNNLDEDPGFLTPIAPDKAPATEGDYRLGDDSIAIDGGNSKWASDGVPAGSEGGSRIVGAAVDLGAYESAVADARSPLRTAALSVDWVDLEGHWAEEYIIEGMKQEIVSGYADQTFKPDSQINRAEFTILLANALGLQGNGGELKFIDNKRIGESARPAIQEAVGAGVIQGFNDSSFRPNRKITRMEMAAMIARAMELEGDAAAPTGFADDSSIPDWARGPIGAMQGAGIISGRGNNLFEPTGNATRAETVVMLLRMVEYIEL